MYGISTKSGVRSYNTEGCPKRYRRTQEGKEEGSKATGRRGEGSRRGWEVYDQSQALLGIPPRTRRSYVANFAGSRVRKRDEALLSSASTSMIYCPLDVLMYFCGKFLASSFVTW